MSPEPNDPDRDRMLQVESRRWSDLTAQRHVRNNWLRSPLVLRHINTLVTGDPDKAWPEVAMERFFPLHRRGGRGVSLGCNDAAFERAIVRTGVCASFDCYDISADAVAAGRAAAQAEGLPMHFHVADVNALELPGERFSLAIVIMALHHVESLEDVCRRLHGALRRDGLFAFDEFVGPKRFQWTKAQVDAANELRRRLPAELRRLPDGRDAGDVTVPDLGRMRREEPFEAIRSDEILPIVRDTFRVLAQRDYGGAALHLALDQFLVNFDEADLQHAAVLQGLCDQERRWVETGALPSDFTVVVAARRDADPAVLGM
jgi:SAM-dependent methyltransferase